MTDENVAVTQEISLTLERDRRRYPRQLERRR